MLFYKTGFVVGKTCATIFTYDGGLGLMLLTIAFITLILQ